MPFIVLGVGKPWSASYGAGAAPGGPCGSRAGDALRESVREHLHEGWAGG